MMVYGIATALSVLLAMALNIRSSYDIDLKRVATYIPLAPFLLVAVLREGVGRDTIGESSTYPRVFAFVESGYGYADVFRATNVEPFYYFLNWLAVEFGFGLGAIYAVMSTIFLIFMYRFIVERSVNIPLSLLLLFASDIFLFALSGIRQAAACAIAFFALRWAVDRRPWMYFMWIAVAAGFHYTALAFVAFYFVAGRRLTSVGWAVLGCLAAAATLMPDIVRRISSVYYGSIYFGSKWDFSNFNLVPAISAAVIVIVALVYSERVSDSDRSMLLYINIMIANLFLMVISASLITPIRLYFLLIPAAFVLVPAIIAAIPPARSVERFFVAFTLIAVVSLQLAYEIYLGNDAYGVWTYNWIFGDSWI